MLALNTAWEIMELRIANMRVRLEEVDPDWRGAHDGTQT